MTRDAIPLIIAHILIVQGCWDDAIIAFELPGDGSSTDTGSEIPTSAEVPTDSETFPDSHESSDTETSADTDTSVDTDTTECEGTYSDALVCTGFENGITLSTQSDDSGYLETVTTPVFEGEASLHATTEGDQNCFPMVYPDRRKRCVSPTALCFFGVCFRRKEYVA